MIRTLNIPKFIFSNEKPPSNSFLKSIFGSKTSKNELSTTLSPPPKKIISTLPPFDKLIDEDILEFTNYSFNLQLKSPFRWTPLIQKKIPSKEFYLKMKEFSKRRYFSDEQSFNELIDTLIFESLKGSQFDYYYDYKCLPSAKCKFHGTLPFLIYHKTHEFHLPFVPVIKSKRVLNKVANVYVDEWNMAEAVGAGTWALNNMKAVDKNNEIQFSRVLHTNGNIWRMYEFDIKGGFKKTGFYTPKNQFKKIYEDYEMQELVNGLIRHSLGELDENEKELKGIYDYLDDKKYFQTIDEETKETIRKRERFWRFLPKKIRTIFFNE